MNSETKGVLGIMFGLLAFANPISNIVLLIYQFFLKNSLTLTTEALMTDYTLITTLAAVIFLILGFYFSDRARREKSKKLALWGLITNILVLIYLVWYVQGLLKVAGWIQ